MATYGVTLDSAPLLRTHRGVSRVIPMAFGFNARIGPRLLDTAPLQPAAFAAPLERLARPLLRRAALRSVTVPAWVLWILRFQVEFYLYKHALAHGRNAAARSIRRRLDKLSLTVPGIVEQLTEFRALCAREDVK